MSLKKTEDSEDQLEQLAHENIAKWMRAQDSSLDNALRKKGRRDFARRPIRAALRGNSLTLAVTTISAEITSTRVFQLAVTFRADANHV